MLPKNLISIIGIIIFLVGIYLGLDSLSDMDKMSKNEMKLFNNIKYIKKLSFVVLSSIIITAIISLFFLSLKFIFPSKPLFNDFFDLGLDCWALILGFLCLLKSIYDKKEFVRSKSI